MIIVVGSKGSALFRVAAFRKEVPRAVLCVNDGQLFFIRRDTTQHTVADFQLIAAHAVALVGAVQQLADIDID
jgi:hypothetical protein